MYVDLPGIFQFLLDDKSLSQSYKSSAGRQRRQYGDTLSAAKERRFFVSFVQSLDQYPTYSECSISNF